MRAPVLRLFTAFLLFSCLCLARWHLMRATTSLSNVFYRKLKHSYFHVFTSEVISQMSRMNKRVLKNFPPISCRLLYRNAKKWRLFGSNEDLVIFSIENENKNSVIMKTKTLHVDLKI